MVKSVSPGYVDTAFSGSTTMTFPRGGLNFTANFRVKANNPGKEVVITNISCPVDRPENLRIAYTPVSNIYAGSGVDPSISAPTKQGVSILCQLTEIQSVTDSVDADYRVDLPLSCHLVIKVPASEHVTAALVHTMVGRLLSGLFDQGATTASRLDSILRGSLVPIEL
jgi:hypothetical protein